MNQPSSIQELKKTPLHSRHIALGARMVPFGGWEMPVEYSSISAEHIAVRTAAGLFDVSHMGEIELAGRDALALLQRLTTNDVASLTVGQAQYSAITTPAGTFIDDVIVYRLAADHFLVVVNAGSVERDYQWIAEHARDSGDVAVVNASSRYALLAVQGPQAAAIVQTLATIDLSSIAYYRFGHGEVAGVRATLSRTGYTGEDGFELFVPPAAADRVWRAILEAGAPHGLVPVGLGARDTLRLEAGLRLAGQDIDDTTTVLEAGLGWIVSWTKGDFIGRAVLEQQTTAGLTRKLIGFEMAGPGIGRHGYKVFTHAGEGVVTSGTHTPWVKKAIGLAYVPAAAAVNGQRVEIDIRGRRVPAVVSRPQFYQRQRS